MSTCQHFGCRFTAKHQGFCGFHDVNRLSRLRSTRETRARFQSPLPVSISHRKQERLRKAYDHKRRQKDNQNTDSEASQLKKKVKKTICRKTESFDEVGTKIGECCICFTSQSDMDSQNLSCGHIYHKKCINQWFSISRTCPECRQECNNIPEIMFLSDLTQLDNQYVF